MMRSDLDIRVDRDLCMGSGNCSFWAPGVFELDDEGISVVQDVELVDEEKVLLAAQGCPTQAISVWHDGQRIDQ